MRGLKGLFKGGIFPIDHTKLSSHSPIWNAVIPSQVLLPLIQDNGPGASPLVQVGDHVREGMMVAAASDPRSSHVHSPIPGIVTKIGDMEIPEKGVTPAISIHLQGEFDRLGKEMQKQEWQTISKKETTELIRHMGIVEMDGTNEPIAHKLAEAEAQGVDTLIINASNSGPYYTAQHRIIKENAEKLVEAIQIIQSIVNCSKIIIALNNKKYYLNRYLRNALDKFQLNAQISKVSDIYPQSDELLLIKRFTGFELGAGESIWDAGVFCIGLNSLLAIYEGVVLRKPSFERVITMAGKALKESRNIKVRIGTSISELIEECGGFVSDPVKIVMGDALKGIPLSTTQFPILKTTQSVLFLAGSEINDNEELDCISCGSCTQACPVGLDPQMLWRLSSSNRTEEIPDYGIEACRECGICSHVCPSRIPLTETIRREKANFLMRIQGN